MSEKQTKKEESDILFRAIDALVPDIVKKLILTSIGGIMLTEEAVRKLLSDLHLSKEIINLIISQTNRAKDEVVRVVSNELRKQVDQIDIHNEIQNILKGTKVNIRMEIDFEPKNGNGLSLDIRPKPASKPKAQSKTKTAKKNK